MNIFQNGRHFDVPAPKWLILLLGSDYQYSLASFNTRKNQKVGHDQNSKWPPFWCVCVKMADFLKAAGPTYRKDIC